MAKREKQSNDTPRQPKESQLMVQFNNLKAANSDAILLFRVGDFYETYGSDAVDASGILGITLTRKANGEAGYIEMAGFPFHAIDTYLPKLVRAGRRVAICEQLEDPKSVKAGKLVRRGVTELITPGVAMGDNVLSTKENSYLCALTFEKQTIGIAFLDLSTGEFMAADGSEAYIDKLIANLSPKEILYSRGEENRYASLLGSTRYYYYYKLDPWVFSEQGARERLMRQLGADSLKGYGIEDMSAAIRSAGAILAYLEMTEHKQTAHITSLSRIERDRYVWVDRFTIANLELFPSGDRSGRSLIETIDRTTTPMAGRMLRHWVTMPLKERALIEERLATVEIFKEDEELSEAVADTLSMIGDLERLASRIATARITPREVVQLARSLAAIEQLQIMFQNSDHPTLQSVAERLQLCTEARQRIEREIYPDPQSNQIAKGGVIASGVDIELDDLRRIAMHGKDVILEIQQREIEATGITSLKVSYNSVFGYYIEVRNTHKDRVPAEWIRKQTLVNAERYITAELKEYEEKIIGAEEKILTIEARIYAQLLEYLAGWIPSLQLDAALIARIDCLHSFARLAGERGYAKPEITDEESIEIRAGRHPVIESLLPVGEQYIPNDVYLDSQHQQIMIITGPNMSGKSALLRQTALIVLMAQIGSYVPASSARIGVVDKIFTRVGASDNISQGESTFMVEMLESAAILNNVTDRSLVLLDEIGRGTSTYDGISIAWSMVEYLHNNAGSRAKTLFATHYHELNELENSLERVKNYNVSVKEVGRKIHFMRRLERGGTEHSFGIHVARMAGMPRKVVARAEDILKGLEAAHDNDRFAEQTVKGPKTKRANTREATQQPQMQLSMFQLEDPVLIQIRDQIRDLDINSLTPLEALYTLNEIKKITGL
ncbi:MAG: DNA mismatch repair protein MutS [Tidjanibacter sp.]|nr:DNA mismatch repair protein MutS [Tidjanibacter sp.]